MRCRHAGQAAVPPSTERARTLATRSGTASVLVAALGRTAPTLHHVHQDGTTIIMLPSDHPVTMQAEPRPGGGRSAMIELTDTAPVALRRPIRGLLWITGWLRALDPEPARRVALELASQRCDERLLDVGYGARLLWLQPVFAVLADAEGIAWLTPTDLAAAEPDPFCHLERDWLRHLDQGRPELLHALGRHIPAASREGRARIRPLGVDRLGLRLRIEDDEQTHDLRLAFHRPATTPAQLAIELHRLVGCGSQ
ncbi:MAG: DUF2470 domain-containing protein [Pseudonocardiaceae bacterium]